MAGSFQVLIAPEEDAAEGGRLELEVGEAVDV